MKLAMVVLALVITAKAAVRQNAPPYQVADDRYKADLLLILAHPDDETGDVAAYLARAVFDEHRRVAVICATRGEGGGNEIGREYGKALGLVREIEARRALASMGIMNVWFLEAPDTPSQNVLQSLEHWDHASALEQTVRIIRLTRPTVIITWLPLVVAGENHADHQAASVIANEAFDLAGDPAAFVEQLAAPNEENGRDLGPTTEGLKPWQPQKLYFYSDAFDAGGYWQRTPAPPSPFRGNFLFGAGPAYESSQISPTRHVSYAQLSAEETSYYLTQDGAIAGEALKTGNFEKFETPTRFVFGKELVRSNMTADVFDGTVASGIPLVPVQRTQPAVDEAVSLEFGGPWAFYQVFWVAHGLEHLGRLLPVPEILVRAGGRVKVPLLINNRSPHPEDITLEAVVPQGWADETRYAIFPVRAQDSYSVEAILTAPSTVNTPWQEIKWRVKVNGKDLGSVVLRVNVTKSRSVP